jgi:tight adherence protein C
MTPTHGPTLLGIDVILVGTILAGVAALAMVLAIYAAVTVKDPMAKRVKALNARRDELKSGIITQKSRKRQSLVQRTETTDKMKDTLKGMKVLQESQVKIIQQKLAQAGIRNKEMAVVVIFLRMILPLVLGFIAVIVIYWINLWPEWGSLKRFMAFAAMVIAG